MILEETRWADSGPRLMLRIVSYGPQDGARIEEDIARSRSASGRFLGQGDDPITRQCRGILQRRLSIVLLDPISLSNRLVRFT